MSEASAKGNITRTHDIIDKAIARRLQKHDPYLALAVAKYWSAQPRKAAAIKTLVEATRKQAKTDPGYLELEV